MKATRPSFDDWMIRFQANLAWRWDLLRKADDELTAAEKERVASSVQAFQIGESSDGRHFKAKARAWADREGEPAYAETVEAFIAEENRHAAMLGAFMDRHGIPRVHAQWTDRIFRQIRRLSGIELCVRVLLAAELIAAVYYRALRDATNSPALAAICTRVLQDESHHIAYQCQAVAAFQRRRGPLARALVRQLYRLFMVGVIGVVWLEHRKVLAGGGYTPVRFAAEVYCVVEDALLMMEGRGDEVRARREAELIHQLMVR